MKIWWCQEHEASSDGPDTWNCLRDGYGPCRLVPMRLIPDNAETVERIRNVLQLQYHLETGFTEDAQAVFAALDGETP